MTVSDKAHARVPDHDEGPCLLPDCEETPSLELVLQVVQDTQKVFQNHHMRVVSLLENALRGRHVQEDALRGRHMQDTNPHTLTFAGTESFEPNSFTFEPSTALDISIIDGDHPKHDITYEPSGFSFLNVNRDAGLETQKSFHFLPQEWHFSALVAHTRLLVRSPNFDFVMGVVILANAVYIGCTIEMDDNPLWVEFVFITVYVIELFLRLWAFGLALLWQDRWIMLDAMLVSLGVVSLIIVEPIKSSHGEGAEIGWLKQVILLRLLRLLRLVRAFRFIRSFKILWGLVNGLLSGVSAILSTFVLLFLLSYMLAVCGVEIITKDENLQSQAETNSALKDVLDNNFDTLPMVMVTLMRFTTADSISGIYEPLVRAKPELIIYFVGILLVVSITIMNLITAVLVEHSIAMAKNDTELENHRRRKAIKKLVPDIENLFTQMDTSADGKVSLQEARHAHLRLPKSLQFLADDPNLLLDLFDALDKDSSGTIDKDEFTEGLVDIALSDVPIETIKLVNYARHMKKQTCKLRRDIVKLSSQVTNHLIHTTSSNNFNSLRHASTVEEGFKPLAPIEEISGPFLQAQVSFAGTKPDNQPVTPVTLGLIEQELQLTDAHMNRLESFSGLKRSYVHTLNV